MGWNSSVLGGSVQESAVHIAGMGVSVVVSLHPVSAERYGTVTFCVTGTQAYPVRRVSQAASPLAENRTDRPRWRVKGQRGACA